MNDSTNKLWVFGDSFGYYNENWIKKLAEKCNCTVAHLGHGGSSIQFLLLDLYTYINQIKQNDRVLVLFTNSHRWYFNHKHYSQSLISRSESAPFGIPIEKINAYNAYILELYNPDEDRAYKGSIVSHIVNTVMPQLPTVHKNYLFSINSKEYVHELNTDNSFKPYCYFINRRKYENDGIWQIALKFIKANKKELNYWENKNQNNATEIADTKNHWINHPEYEKYFWKYVDPILTNMYS